jgi:hypothetical protein
MRNDSTSPEHALAPGPGRACFLFLSENVSADFPPQGRLLLEGGALPCIRGGCRKTHTMLCLLVIPIQDRHGVIIGSPR